MILPSPSSPYVLWECNIPIVGWACLGLTGFNVAAAETGQLSASLGEDWLIKHKNKDVRLLVACALADVLRIYAPDPP